MPTRSLLYRLAALATCILATACLLFQPGAVTPRAMAQPPAGKTYFGANSCSGCHSNPENSRFPTDFCLLNEYDIWKSKDKHSQAYEVLTWERSKRMGDLLGIEDVTKANECLGCHAVIATEAQRARTFNIADGVSCDACHGPSGLWFSLHFTDPTWRTLPADQKEADYGMKDVRDPVKRAEMCMSCHIGNTEEQKVVTHAMYAAGHPPLPSFEIETFVNEEPMHWRYLKDKPKEIQDLFKYDPKVMHRTKLTMLGGLVALRESVELFGSQAAQLQDQWPELAQFDCYACHHDLSKPRDSWRLARGFESWRLLGSSKVPPGRPQMREWTSVLAILALLHAGQTEEQITAALAPLHQALVTQPYGRPDAVTQAAAKVTSWLNEQIKTLQARTFDRQEAESILTRISQMASDPKHVLDFDSARLLAWAFQIIYQEVHGEPAGPVQEALAQLNEHLKLNLPSGHDQQILQQLPETLQTLSSYTPSKAGALFKELAKAAGNN